MPTRCPGLVATTLAAVLLASAPVLPARGQEPPAGAASPPAPRPAAPGGGDPAGADLDPAALAALLERARQTESDALLVVRDGVTLVDERFGREDGPIEAMSATKSVLALAFGRLLADGRLDSLDAPVHRWYPEWNQGRKASITLRHLLTHRSGLQSEPITTEIYRAPDFVQLALAAELSEHPGTTFRYNNKATNLLAGLVGRIGGARLDVLLGEELFAPLGISDWSWSLDGAGNPHGMAGLQIRPADLARIGELLLADGVWEGQRLLPAAFVAECTRDQVHPAADDPDAAIGDLWGRPCGLLWWIEADTQFAITERLLAEWRRTDAPADFVTAMTTLLDVRGEELARRTLELAGGEERWAALTWQAGRPDFDVVGWDVVGFSAEGYLGQYLLVLPEQRLVAVRMRRAPAEAAAGRVDAFADFKDRVRALVARDG